MTQVNRNGVSDAGTAFDTLDQNQKTVTAAGTAEQILNVKAPGVITFRALTANTNDMYIGLSDVDDTNGYVLDSIDPPLTLRVPDISALYLDADTNGEGISYVVNY